MNERIRELAEQAGMGPMGIAFSSEIMQKFAELIVRECMTICDEVQDKYGQYTFTARVCKERFREHFGVE